jgi:ADP-heptose:LPS heptosyltransferase
MVNSRALVIFRKQMGDVLLLQPALEHLSKSVGSVDLYARSGFADLLALMPGNIRLAESTLFPQAEEVYCLEARPAAMLYAARTLGARRRLLLSRDIAPWWQRLIFDQYTVLSGTHVYRAKLYQDLFGFADQPFLPPRLNLPPPDWAPTGLPAAYRVLHPTAAWEHKTWAAENWAETLAKLDDGTPWLVTCGPSDWEVALASDIARRCRPGQVFNLAGKTSLRQFLAVIAGAQATLCVDGSASHISTAFGHPTLTLFGPTNATRWHLPGSHTPCLKASDFATERKPPVNAIPVSAVVTTASRLLGSAP